MQNVYDSQLTNEQNCLNRNHFRGQNLSKKIIKKTEIALGFSVEIDQRENPLGITIRSFVGYGGT